MSASQHDGSNSTIEISSSQVILAYVRLTEASQHSYLVRKWYDSNHDLKISRPKEKVSLGGGKD